MKLQNKVFHVYWHLEHVDACGNFTHAIYTPERLLQMARRVLSWEAPFYKIYLFGGNHPFYRDLIVFFLSQHKPLLLTLYATGLESKDFWNSVLEYASPGQLRIELQDLPDRDIRSLLTFIAIIAEHGQIVYVDPGSNHHLRSLLIQFRKTVPFKIEGLEEEHGSEIPSLPASEPVDTKSDQCMPGMGAYCHMGFNYIRIEPDGHFYNAPCEDALGYGPFWQTTNNGFASICSVRRCRKEKCPLPQIMPVYKNRADVVSPIPILSPGERALLIRLQNLAQASQSSTPSENKSIESLPPALIKQVKDIAQIYYSLGDPPSRESFLRSLLLADSGNIGWQRSSVYPCGKHPEVLEKPGDVHFREIGRYCQWIAPQRPVENFDDIAGTIQLYTPRLALPLTSDQIISVPLKLLHHNYKLYWGWHGSHAGVVYAIHPSEERPLGTQPIIHNRISIIIPFHNNEDTLERCFDSALIQGYPNIEIIAVDDASTDTSSHIAAEYARRWPKQIRWRQLEKNMGPGYARNVGMSMASGEYMTFIDADDVMAPGFLKTALEAVEKHDADIVGFDIVQLHPGKYPRILNIESGEFSHPEALYALMLKSIGRYATYGRLYGTQFIRQNNIRYSDTRVHQDIFFSMRAFSQAQKSVVLSQAGYLRYQRPGVSHAAGYYGPLQLIAFASFVRFITELFEAQNLDQESDAFRYCIRRLYTWDRERMFRAIREAAPDDPVVNKAILDIGYCREAIRLILADYSATFNHKFPNPLPVYEEDRDWRQASAIPLSEPTITAYADAERPSHINPVLSVIVPNYNSLPYLPNSLDSILKQDMPDFEVIIIDDASTDGSYELLQDYAAIDDRIRLFRLSENSRQGRARNVGIEHARGRYIIFVDADDICLPGYFRVAVRIIERDHSDMAILGSRRETRDGNTWDRPGMEEGILNHMDGLKAFWERSLNPEPWAKIYRTNILQGHGCLFPACVYHQDVPFIFSVLLVAQRITVCNRIFYQQTFSKNSTIRPSSARYLQIHSAYVLYSFIKEALDIMAAKYGTEDRDAGAAIIDWNIKNVLLNKLAAFRDICGEIPMTNSDFALLKNNAPFLISLLRGIAALSLDGLPPGTLVECETRPSRVWKPTASKTPIVSVIMPLLNEEDTLADAVKAILSQSMPDLELILVDLGSKDATSSLCAQFVKDDARVRYMPMETLHAPTIPALFKFANPFGEYTFFAAPNAHLLLDFLLHCIAPMQADPEINIALAVPRSDHTVQDNIVQGNVVIRLLSQIEIGTNSFGATVWRTSFLKNYSPVATTEDSFSFLLEAAENAGSVFIFPIRGFQAPKAPGYLSSSHAARCQISRCAWYEKRGFFDKIGLSDSNEDLRGSIRHDFIEVVFGHISRLARLGVPVLQKEDLAELRGMPRTMLDLLAQAAHLENQNRPVPQTLPAKDFSVCEELMTTCAPAHPMVDPLLSLVVYARNNATSIATFPSMLDKRLHGLVEIIFVDDCSQDTTRDIILQLSKGASSLSVSGFETPWPAGIVSCWNLAFKKCRGRYVYFTEADEAPALAWLAGNNLPWHKDSDIVFAGSSAATAGEALTLFFNNEINCPVFRHAFLHENNIVFSSCSQPHVPHFAVALLRASKILNIPCSVHTPGSVWDKPWALEDFLRMHQSLLSLIREMDQFELVEKAYAQWLFNSQYGFMPSLLRELRKKPRPEIGSVQALMQGDSHLEHLMRELASTFERTTPKVN